MNSRQNKSIIFSVVAVTIAAIAPIVSLRVGSQRIYQADFNPEAPRSQAKKAMNAMNAMNRKPMSEEDLVEMLKEGKEKGYISGNLPSDPVEVKAMAHEIHENLIYELSEGEMRVETGRQQLILKNRPTGEWNESTDRRLSLFFEGPEWSALFHDVLRAKDPVPFVVGEAFEKWRERQRASFQESIRDYPMLGRIWDTYIDAHYQPEEVSQLRDECLRVKSSTSNVTAISGLDKLIAGCDEALKDRLGLSLLSE